MVWTHKSEGLQKVGFSNCGLCFAWRTNACNPCNLYSTQQPKKGVLGRSLRNPCADQFFTFFRVLQVS